MGTSAVLTSPPFQITRVRTVSRFTRWMTTLSMSDRKRAFFCCRERRPFVHSSGRFLPTFSSAFLVAASRGGRPGHCC